MDHYVESQVRFKSRLDRIEQDLGLVPDGPAVSDLVTQLAHDGKTLDTIRVYRDETGTDLAAAKEVVESIHR